MILANNYSSAVIVQTPNLALVLGKKSAQLFRFDKANNQGKCCRIGSAIGGISPKLMPREDFKIKIFYRDLYVLVF
ncbi:MAG: hypothetical protein ACI8YQ_000507 [Polaribacter sp.]|jgi:hypothetical protein